MSLIPFLGKGGFHVTSYQANFASHHTRNRHIGFLFTCKGIEKSNKTYHYYLLSSYHITKLQPSDKNINTHLHEISNPCMNKSKVLLLFFSIPRCANGNQDILKNRARESAYHFVQALYYTKR